MKVSVREEKEKQQKKDKKKMSLKGDRSETSDTRDETWKMGDEGQTEKQDGKRKIERHKVRKEKGERKR